MIQKSILVGALRKKQRSPRVMVTVALGCELPFINDITVRGRAAGLQCIPATGIVLIRHFTKGVITPDTHP